MCYIILYYHISYHPLVSIIDYTLYRRSYHQLSHTLTKLHLDQIQYWIMARHNNSVGPIAMGTRNCMAGVNTIFSSMLTLIYFLISYMFTGSFFCLHWTTSMWVRVNMNPVVRLPVGQQDLSMCIVKTWTKIFWSTDICTILIELMV